MHLHGGFLLSPNLNLYYQPKSNIFKTDTSLLVITIAPFPLIIECFTNHHNDL